jgi:hypothetical protein
MNALDKILARVQNLLAQADHPNTGKPEADAFRAKAEALMIQYRIEEVTAKPDAAGAAPIWRDIVICEMGNAFTSEYRYLWADVMMHFGARSVSSYKDGNVVATAVGYESDLRFAEALYLTAALAFGDRLEPKYNPDQTDQVNAYRMRMAGMEGHRIAQAIYGRDDKNLRPKVRAMFKKEAEARGEDPTPLLGKGVNVKQYRKDYADGFVTEFYYRLAAMRRSRGENEGGLVLVGRKEAVDEAFYEAYPHYRPAPVGTKVLPGQGDCAKCAKAKSGYCREHGYLRPRAARQGARTNHAARAAGRNAAKAVDLGYKAPAKLPDNRPGASKALGL